MSGIRAARQRRTISQPRAIERRHEVMKQRMTPPIRMVKLERTVERVV